VSEFQVLNIGGPGRGAKEAGEGRSERGRDGTALSRLIAVRGIGKAQLSLSRIVDAFVGTLYEGF
jgi:hypothetical protein